MTALIQLLDKFACWWLDKRMDSQIRDSPELQELGIKKVEFDANGFHAIASFPGVVILADEAAALLEANGARNYVEFEMLPRLDRGKRPIRITVQWVAGKSPAQQATRLREALMEMVQQHCFCDEFSLIHADALSANENAILLLCEEGCLEMVDGGGYQWCK